MIDAFMIAGLDAALPVCFFSHGYTADWNGMMRKKREQFILARLSMDWSFRFSCTTQPDPRKQAAFVPASDPRQLNSSFEEGVTELQSPLFPPNAQAYWRAQFGTALIVITSQEENVLLVSQFLKAMTIALNETFKANVFYAPLEMTTRADEILANLAQLLPHGQLLFINNAFLRQLRRNTDTALN